MLVSGQGQDLGVRNFNLNRKTTGQSVPYCKLKSRMAEGGRRKKKEEGGRRSRKKKQKDGRGFTTDVLLLNRQR